MSISDLQKAIKDAVDQYGVPDKAEVRVATDAKGKVNIRAEYGCGHYLLVADVNGQRGAF